MLNEIMHTVLLIIQLYTIVQSYIIETVHMFPYLLYMC